MGKSIYFKAVIILSVLGIFLASYLYYNYLTRPAIQICTINDRVNCDAVTKGVLATVAGVPVSLVGLIGYILILVSALIKNSKAVLALALFGTIFCLRITYLEIFNVKVFCPVCIGCQLDMIAVLVISLFYCCKSIDKPL